MNIASRLLFPIIFLQLATQSFAFEGPPGCSMDCASCHSLSAEEAGKILKIEVNKVSDSPVKGIWQIDGEVEENKKVRVYLDFAKKNVLLINNFLPRT